MKNIKKRLIGWTLGLALSLGVGIGIASNTHSEIAGVEAAETAIYTLAIKRDNTNNDYTKTKDFDCGGITWNIPGNQGLGNYIKLGGKLSTATTRSIYSKGAINENISKIVVNSSAIDKQITLISLVAKGYSTAADAASGSESNLVFSQTISTYSNAMTFEQIENGNNLFYRFDFTMTSSSPSKNYGISIVSIDFFTPSLPASPLSSITLSGQTTEYFVGQNFAFTGVCTAQFEDGSTQEVKPTTVSEPDMLTAGQKTIDVSYTAGEITKTASYTITVKPARTKTDIALHGKMSKTKYIVGDKWDLTGLDLEVSWSDGEPTYLSLDDKAVICECNPGAATDVSLTSFSLEVIYENFDKTFVVDGFTVVAKSYASLVTSAKDLWDGQEIYFASTAEATKVSALHAGGNNLKSVDGTYVKDKGLSIDDTANAKAYTVGRVELEGTTYYTFSFMSETGIKYLADTGTSSKNTLQLSDEIIDTASSCVYFTISVSTTDGTATIKSKSNTAKSYLMWNEGNDIFSCYASGQKNPYLFAVTPYSGTTVANAFADRYLHMDENVDGQCKTYYPVLKSVWAAMSIDEKLSIEATAQDRLEAWATANGEQLDSGMNLVSNANFIIKGSEIKDGDAFALIAVVSMVSATAIGSFFFIRKRKEQN